MYKEKIAFAGWIFPLFATTFTLTAAAQAISPGSFAIHNGDKIVFYGDSITAQRRYTTFVEEYLLTRFPQWDITVTESGVGGDRVSGGAAGPIDLRLERDVFAHHPSVVTIMLGINDGLYSRFHQSTATSYENGYRYMVDQIVAGDPGVRITSLGPSPYDDVTRPTLHYNEVVQAFSKFDQQLAREKNLGFCDLNAPVIDVLEKTKESHPPLATELIPDRIHPGEGVHWIMAAEILKCWGAPSVVSQVEIDGDKAKTLSSTNAAITELSKKKDHIKWTEKEDALPLPLPNAGADPVEELALDAGGIVDALDQELLTVAHLSPGNYRLSVDGVQVGSFSADQLASSINLARRQTPMLRQAWAAALDTEHRNQLESSESDVFAENFGLEVPDPKLQALQDAVKSSTEQQIRDAQTVPHTFELVKIQ